MAEAAGTGDITVFKSGYLLPVGGDMAILASFTGGHMVRGLALTAHP